ncbi:MAG TPA: hypothetical protein VGL09_11235 [Methylomirabilota bacterium]|jgi:hypothetical protein
MRLQRVRGCESFAEAFERELDKGVVLDSSARLRPLVVNLVTVEAHVQVRPLEIVATIRS